jgi:hypothetical protein
MLTMQALSPDRDWRQYYGDAIALYVRWRT